MLDESATVIQIAGQLQSEGVAELERVIDGAAGPLILDLAELIGADAPALGALRRLESRGAVLRGVSPYMRLRLHPDRSRAHTSGENE